MAGCMGVEHAVSCEHMKPSLTGRSEPERGLCSHPWHISARLFFSSSLLALQKCSV